MDYALNDRWLVGVSFSYANAEIDFDHASGAGLGSGDVDTYRLGPYLGYANGPWSAQASLTYAYHDHEQDRINPGTGDRFTSSFDSYDIAAFLGGGYTFDLRGWKITPNAAAQYTYTHTDAFEESGPGGALAVDDSDFDSLRSTLGLSVARVFRVANTRLMPRAQVGWAHEYLDDGEHVNARFVGGNSPFTLTAVGREGDSFYYGAGVTAPAHRPHLARRGLPRRDLRRWADRRGPRRAAGGFLIPEPSGPRTKRSRPAMRRGGSGVI